MLRDIFRQKQQQQTREAELSCLKRVLRRLEGEKKENAQRTSNITTVSIRRSTAVMVMGQNGVRKRMPFGMSYVKRLFDISG